MMFLVLHSIYLGDKTAGSHSERLPATTGEGHKKSSALFQKICWEEPEKQKTRSCRRRNYPEAVPRKMCGRKRSPY